MYTENPVSEKNAVNQESQALLSAVGGRTIKINTCMGMTDNKAALRNSGLNL